MIHQHICTRTLYKSIQHSKTAAKRSRQMVVKPHPSFHETLTMTDGLATLNTGLIESTSHTRRHEPNQPPPPEPSRTSESTNILKHSQTANKRRTIPSWQCSPAAHAHNTEDTANTSASTIDDESSKACPKKTQGLRWQKYGGDGLQADVHREKHPLP